MGGGWRAKFGLRKLLGRPPNDDSDARDEHPERPPPIKTRPLENEPSAIWNGTVPVAGRRVLPPDPRMMRAIGLNHSFESAIADIIDNSIDAGARTVLVRIVRDAEHLLSLCIVDDGRGMDEPTIDRAMTVGGNRSYDDRELGHFGIGLKAASLGQARVLTVVSKSAHAGPVGRRWLMESAAAGFECDVVRDDFAASLLVRDWQCVTPSPGTVVMWTQVKNFTAIADTTAVDRFVDNYLMTLRHHLGLVFHRLLAAGKFRIAVDVEDVSAREIGLRFEVAPIDPFGYARSARSDYPRTLKSAWGDHPIELRCHIWPGRSSHANFKLLGGQPEPYQGFYFYRNDRLLQHGTWNGAIPPERELQLARVAIDIGPSLAALFSMNAEKTRVEALPEFGAVVKRAADGKTTFLNYVDHAKSSYRDSQKRRRERPKVMRPGKGFAEAVRSAVDAEYDFLAGDALDIRWGDLDDDTFFEIDRESSVIRLNRRYRAAVIGGRDSSLNDAPLVKSLIYLLAEGTFHGTFLGAKAKDNLAIWQAILTAAARTEAK